MHRGSTGGRRRTLTRLVTLLALVATAVGVLLPAVGAESPYSTISPQSPQGDDIQWLYKLIFYLSLIVFVGVQPTLTQVPPTCSRSTTAVFHPAAASATASGFPPWPVPITMASKSIGLGIASPSFKPVIKDNGTNENS